MCNLKGELKWKRAHVYKGVAVRKYDATDSGMPVYDSGRCYSLAMGFLYQKGPVPIVHKQHAIRNEFIKDILASPAYNEDMVGRTAGFIHLGDALRAFIVDDNTTLLTVPGSNPEWLVAPHGVVEFNLGIARFTISKELMRGTYQVNEANYLEVIAGKHIDEIKLLYVGEPFEVLKQVMAKLCRESPDVFREDQNIEFTAGGW